MLPQSTVDPPQLARGTRRNNKIQLEKWTKGENRYLTQEDTRMAKEPGEDAGQCRSVPVLTDRPTQNRNETRKPDATMSGKTWGSRNPARCRGARKVGWRLWERV